jgi:hypothetical protein
MYRRLSPRTRALLLASALALFAPPTPSQTTQPQPSQDEEVVRISSDLVQTDVMVFDKSGKFVEGLKPEHFELKVDGRQGGLAPRHQAHRLALLRHARH